MSSVLKKNIPDISRFKPKHAPAIQANDELEGWDEYFKFAFVRNPWDRLVSWYSMIRNVHSAPLDQIPMNVRKKRYLRQAKNNENNRLWRYVLDNSSSFEEFISNCTGEIEINNGVFCSFTYNQLDYVSDSDGDLLVDFIGRFENFESDLRKVSNRLSLDLESVPRRNRSPHTHYSSFYTPETEMIVRERFKRDIEYFGYKFENTERPA